MRYGQLEEDLALIRQLQGSLKDLMEAKCSIVRQMTAQVIATVTEIEAKGISEVEESMRAKIDRVSEGCKAIESEYMPRIKECKEVAEVEEMVKGGRHMEAIERFYVQGMGQVVRGEATFAEAQGLTREITQDLREVKQAAGRGEQNEHMQ